MKASYYSKLVDSHKADLSLPSESRDFIEAYLKVLWKVKGGSETTFSGEDVYRNMLYYVV